MTALAAFDLYRFFHTGESETLALRGASLTVEAGEMVAVVGPSGSGKSTLLASYGQNNDPRVLFHRKIDLRLSLSKSFTAR